MMGVVAAIVAGAVGTVVLVAYVRGAEDRAVSGEKLVGVVVATHPVDVGTAADTMASLTKTEQVPAKVRPADAITSLSEVRNLVTATALVPGELLLKDRFAVSGQVSQGVGAVKIPAGDTEITLSLEPQRAVGGLVKPGGRVMVVGTPGNTPASAADIAVVVAHQVLVTDVQVDTSSGQPSRDQTQTQAPTKNLLVTLAVDDLTATKVLAFADGGNVWLGAEQQLTPLTGSFGR
jgi:pilus assembly protein CpaB